MQLDKFFVKTLSRLPLQQRKDYELLFSMTGDFLCGREQTSAARFISFSDTYVVRLKRKHGPRL